MKLRNIVAVLRARELRNISIGKELHKIIIYINLGVNALHKEFPLIQTKVDFTLPDVPAKAKEGESETEKAARLELITPELPKEFKSIDLARKTVTTTSEVLQVLQVMNVNGHEFPINNIIDPNAVNILSYNTIGFPFTKPEDKLVLLLKMTPTPIDTTITLIEKEDEATLTYPIDDVTKLPITNPTAEQTATATAARAKEVELANPDIQLPEILAEALLHHIGYSAYAATKGSFLKEESNTHLDRFHEEVHRLRQLGVLPSENTANSVVSSFFN